MVPIAVSYFLCGTSRFFSRDYLVITRIIIIKDNNLGLFRRYGQSANIFSEGNINGSWNQIRYIAGSFFVAGTIINGHWRETQIWATTINCNGIF